MHDNIGIDIWGDISASIASNVSSNENAIFIPRDEILFSDVETWFSRL